jgi:hypothetical protein
LQFITEPDPFLAMLKWVMTEMMRIEAEAKVGATNGKHAKEPTTYFSGARAQMVTFWIHLGLHCLISGDSR